MSRNLRHHRAKGTVPAKHSARRPSTTENSSDDDYAGVDLISDSEDDEPDVEVAEEQAIIQSAEESDADDDDAHNASRPHEDDDASSWNGFDDTIDDGGAFFEDHIARGYAPDTVNDVATFDALHGECSDDEPTRRVRFDVVEESESEDEDDMFPDIFLAQNDLDPNFRKAIESNEGNDDHIGSSDDGSYWDYHEDERRLGELENVEEHSQSASETSSSTDYESKWIAASSPSTLTDFQPTKEKRPRKISQTLPNLCLPALFCVPRLPTLMHRIPRPRPRKCPFVDRTRSVDLALAPGCTTAIDHSLPLTSRERSCSCSMHADIVNPTPRTRRR